MSRVIATYRINEWVLCKLMEYDGITWKEYPSFEGWNTIRAEIKDNECALLQTVAMNYCQEKNININNWHYFKAEALDIILGSKSNHCHLAFFHFWHLYFK